MDGITILYMAVSLLYLYMGIRALVLDRNNVINRAFLITTGCLFIRTVSLIMAGFIRDAENIMIVRALAAVAGYAFFSSLMYFSVCFGGAIKVKRALLFVICALPVAVDIALYLLPTWSGEATVLSGPVSYGHLYDFFLAAHIAAGVILSQVNFYLWRIKNKEKHQIPYLLVLCLLSFASVAGGGYYYYREHFAESAGISLLIFAIQMGILYYLVVKNEFLEKDVSASVVKMLELMQGGFLITSQDYTINRANDGAEKISGYSVNQLYGRDARTLFENMQTGSAILLCANGTSRDVMISETSITDPVTRIVFRILCFRDIENIKKMETELLSMNEVLEDRVERRRVVLYTIQQKLEKEIEEKKKLEEELSRLVYYDMLTELPNRVMINERLKKVIRREQRYIGILAINIDNFKRINDTIGHNEGDRILIQLADLIRSRLHPGEMAARVEGDEFLLLLNKIYSEDDIRLRAEELQENVKQAFYIKNLKLYMTMSIGGAVYIPGMTANELIYNANVALYGAKMKGVNGVEVYSGEGRNYLKEKIKMRQEIERAIGKDEFELYYQPQVLTESEKVSGTEALLRWNHPENGIVLPGTFIPQIENENLIIKLGEWVIENACRQIREWERKDKREFLPLSINLSMRHFETEDILHFLKEMIEKYRIKPSNLKIEITESFRSDELFALRTILSKIRDEDISLSVDDFGTGYSSFHYLKNIQADVLKIPREYITGIGKNKKSELIVKSMIELAHDLEMVVIAEGVESLEEKEFLAGQLCDVIQGYYYFRPMNKEALENIS